MPTVKTDLDPYSLGVGLPSPQMKGWKMRITMKEYRNLIKQGVKPIIQGAAPLPVRTNGKVDGVYDSKLERDYARRLEMLKHAREIWDWMYHPMRLRLADGTYYTPDFLVVMPGGLVEFHETKGFMREAARVRLNVAADKFKCFAFRLVKREGAGFSITQI